MSDSQTIPQNAGSIPLTPPLPAGDGLREFFSLAREGTTARHWQAKFKGGVVIFALQVLLSSVALLALSGQLSLNAILVLKLALTAVALTAIGYPLTSDAHRGDISLGLACLISLFAHLEAVSLGKIFGADFWSLAVFDLPCFILALAALKRSLAVQRLESVRPASNPYVALRVQTARLYKGGRSQTVATETLAVGDVVEVLPGEKIPRDGVMIKGTTSVDESELTSEFHPLLKEAGDPVVGGSVNRDTLIHVQIQAQRGDDILEKLIAWAETSLKAATSPAPGIDSPETVGLVAALILSAAVGAVSFLVLGRPAPQALALALSALVVAPAGLRQITQIASLGYLGACWKRGIALSGGKALERLSQVTALFFNKTGTLSQGDFVYSQCFIEPGTNQGEMLAALFAIEDVSRHPLSNAMVTHPWFVEIPHFQIKDIEEHPGLGVCGMVRPRGEKEFFAAAGNLRFVKRMRFNVSRDMRAKIDDLEEMGETVILVGYDRYVRGILSFSDTLRRGIRRTLRKIRELGIETVLITGDTEKTVTQLTGNLGIEKIHSRCTPDEKAQKIAKAKEGGAVVALLDNDVVGDQPAFRAAHLSLCVDVGTDIRGRPVDVILMGSDISLLHWLFETARRGNKTMKLVSWGWGGLAVVTALAAFAGAVLPQIPAALACALTLFGLKPPAQEPAAPSA